MRSESKDQRPASRPPLKQIGSGGLVGEPGMPPWLVIRPVKVENPVNEIYIHEWLRFKKKTKCT